MKRWSWLVVVLALLSSLAVSPKPAHADSRGWALCMTSPHAGVWYVYLSPDGMAAVNKKLGATMVTRGPDWNVVLYNDKTRVFYSCPLQEWSMEMDQGRTGRVKAAAHRLTSHSPEKGTSGVVAGLPATQYFVYATHNGSSPRRMELWATQTIQVPEQIRHLLARTYGLTFHDLNGMVLKAGFTDEAGKKVSVVDTVKCEQRPIQTASFSYPTSYTRVADKTEVFLDEKSKQAIADLAEDLSSGDEELDALLGSSASVTRPPIGGGGQPRPPVKPRAAVNSPSPSRPTAASQPPPGKQADWWGNLMNSFQQK